MKPVLTLVAVLILACLASPQERPKPVTVPITLDHNRIVIDVYLPLPDRTSKRVRAWVDTGNSDMLMSQRIASLFGSVNCVDKVCNATPPSEVVIGGMKISLSDVHSAHVPAGVPKDAMVPGMSPEINLPSTVLRAHDVVFDYPNRQFTIGGPGTVPFKGKPSKAQISDLGLIQIASQIEGQSYNLVLDTGSSMSFISSELLSKWHTTHPAWPFMTGAVGAANMFGTPEETERFVLRLPSLQYGTSALNQVSIASLPPNLLDKFKQRAGSETVGLLGGDAFRNYRVGIDYAHSAVYLDHVSNTPASDVSVVGLTLRPEPDGRYTVVAVVDYQGKPAVPDVNPGDVLLGVDGASATGATLGQVWSLLGGSPGQTRSLTLEREGKRLTVDAPIHPFLAAPAKESRITKITQRVPKKR
jgi:hypothetical protein